MPSNVFYVFILRLRLEFSSRPEFQVTSGWSYTNTVGLEVATSTHGDAIVSPFLQV
jgi:hypothetical protein